MPRQKIMKIGKPCHFRPNKDAVTACGLVGEVHYSAYDGRDCDCLSCMKTNAYKIYMGKKEMKNGSLTKALGVDSELLQAIQGSSDIVDLAFQFQTTVSGMARRIKSLGQMNLAYRYNKEVWLTDEGRELANKIGSE